MQAEVTQACPNCGAGLPVVQPYVTWCDTCGWNITAPERPLPPGRFEQLYEEAGRRAGERMERELTAADQLEPRLTASKALAYAIAAGVHLLTLLLVVGGIVLVALFPTKIFAIVAAVLAISLAILVRPRLGKPPKDNLVPRSDAPTLVRLVDRVAETMETKTADLLVVDEEYNASWGVFGLRRTRVLHLGLPLLSALEPQERVALIAHEIAHARNDDSSRGLFVGSACRGVAQWYFVLAPHCARSPYHTGVANHRLAEHVANAMLWALSRPPLLLFRLEVHLRSTTHAGPSTWPTRSRRGRRARTRPSARTRNSCSKGPFSRSSGSTRNSRHGQRIRLLERRPIRSAQVVLSSADSDAIDRELAGLRPASSAG